MGRQGFLISLFLFDVFSVCKFIIIDTSRTRPRLAPDKPDEFFAAPKQIAKEMFRSVYQDKSAGSFRVE